MAINAALVATNFNTASTANLATASVTTSGSGTTFVVCAGATATWATANRITDNKGNTYVRISTDATAFTVSGTMWYCENAAVGAGHIFTATPDSSGIIYLSVIQITGGAVTGILDKTTTPNDDVASPFTSNTTATLSQAAEVAIAFQFDNRSSGTAIVWGNSYTSLDDQTNTSGITGAVSKLVTSSTAAQTSSFTNAATTEAVSFLATFKELGGGGATFTLMGQACL